MKNIKYKIIDTSIIIDGPSEVFTAFLPHSQSYETKCIIPLEVLAELDELKQEVRSDRGQAAREFWREMVRYEEKAMNLFDGIVVETDDGRKTTLTAGLKETGTEFSETNHIPDRILRLGSSAADSYLLKLTYALQEQEKDVELIANDSSLRIMALSVGLKADSWRDLRAIDAIDQLYKGWRDITGLPGEVYGLLKRKHSLALDDLHGTMKDGRLLEELVSDPRPNEYFIATNNTQEFDHCIMRWDARQEKFVRLEYYARRKNKNITARNARQACFMDALNNHEITLAIGMGEAGTGKTFLALEAALAITGNDDDWNEGNSIVRERLEKAGYEIPNRIMVARAVGSDEEHGFIPGSFDKKYSPWIGGILDNVRNIIKVSTNGETDAEINIERARGYGIETFPFSFMRGRTPEQAIIIAEELQNAHPKKALTLLSRPGKGTRVIITGDPRQIDVDNRTPLDNALVAANQSHIDSDSTASIYFPPEDSTRSSRARESIELLTSYFKRRR